MQNANPFPPDTSPTQSNSRAFQTNARSSSAGVPYLLVMIVASGLSPLSAIPIQAQESVRMSLASAEAAEARTKTASMPGFYNLKLGPTAWNFNAAAAAEYNDNIGLNPNTNQASDVIFRPQLNTRMRWAVTEQNNLNLTLGGGYSAYAQHSELDRFFIIPGSELSFDLYSGDIWLNLHDRFSITEDNYQDPTVVGAANYSRLDNALGIGAVWDLNKVIQKFGFDHVDYLALTGNRGQPNGRSEVISSSTSFAIKPGMLVGVELGGGLTHYSNVSTNSQFVDAVDWNGGVFYDTQLSEYVRGRVSSGYTQYMPDSPSRSQRAQDFTGIYAALELSHRLNEYVTYVASGGRTINFAFYGGTFDLYYARLQASWNLLQKISLSTGFEYQHGTEAYFAGETFDRYGVQLAFGRAITTKLSGSLSCQYYWRGSNLTGRNYKVNSVALNLTYRF